MKTTIDHLLTVFRRLPLALAFIGLTAPQSYSIGSTKDVDIGRFLADPPSYDFEVVAFSWDDVAGKLFKKLIERLVAQSPLEQAEFMLGLKEKYPLSRSVDRIMWQYSHYLRQNSIQHFIELKVLLKRTGAFRGAYDGQTLMELFQAFQQAEHGMSIKERDEIISLILKMPIEDQLLYAALDAGLSDDELHSKVMTRDSYIKFIEGLNVDPSITGSRTVKEFHPGSTDWLHYCLRTITLMRLSHGEPVGPQQFLSLIDDDPSTAALFAEQFLDGEMPSIVRYYYFRGENLDYRKLANFLVSYSSEDSIAKFCYSIGNNLIQGYVLNEVADTFLRHAPKDSLFRARMLVRSALLAHEVRQIPVSVVQILFEPPGGDLLDELFEERLELLLAAVPNRIYSKELILNLVKIQFRDVKQRLYYSPLSSYQIRDQLRKILSALELAFPGDESVSKVIIPKVEKLDDYFSELNTRPCDLIFEGLN